MKKSQNYYRRVISSLFDKPGQRISDQLLDQVIHETDGPALIDDFRERFKTIMSEHLKQVKNDGDNVEEPGATSISVTPYRDDGGGSLAQESSAVSNRHPLTPDADKAPLPSAVPQAVSKEQSIQAVSHRSEHLPNGRAGQPYQVSLDEVLSDLPVTLQLVDDGGSHLTLSEDRYLHGIPQSNGTRRLQVEGLDHQGRSVLQLTLTLALIPNSRDLWKDLPSDSDAPYAKPDEDTDRRSGGKGWLMAMGSQRGRSHAHRGGQRDDHGAIARSASGWNILIVGDGAGSCVYSRQGSLLATTVARDELLSTLEANDGAALEAAALSWWNGGDRSRMSQELLIPLQQTMITAVHAGHRAITEEANMSGQLVKAFSTTLLIALHKETVDGHIVVTFGVGDGAVAALCPDRQALMLNVPDSGEHAGQTRFLDSALFQQAESLYQRVKVNVFSSLDALVLATDGVTDPKFSSDDDMQDGESWWAFYDELEQALAAPDDVSARDPLQDYLSFFVERHHDDRTLAVLYRNGDVSAAKHDVEVSS